MDSHVKLLILEHDPNDIDLLKFELKKGLKNYSLEIVQTEEAFIKAIVGSPPDIILSDYSLPSFDGVSAFYLKQKFIPDIPFIIVSGTIGEENAIELIKNGVTDYVLKDKLFSLIPKLHRALSEAQSMREKAVAELALQKSEANLRAMFNNTDVGFLFLNSFMEVMAFNSMSKHWASRSFGVELKENINFRNLVKEENLQMFDALMANVLAGTDVNYETAYPKLDGGEVWFNVNIKPIRDEDECIIGICIAINDITKRKSAENEVRMLNVELEDRVKQRTSELIEANQSLEAYSYSVSHDLRSPLRSIMGFSQIIQRQYINNFPEDLKELFEHIQNSTERMSAIIEDLLSLAKYGKQKLQLNNVDMNQLVNSVWEGISKYVNHKVNFQLAELPVVVADKSMMEQVLVNLLSNALKYSSKVKSSEIEVGFEEEKDSIVFYVKDNGAGFDMKHYDKLFGAFQRLHSPSDFEGTGVGLTLVKRIIEKHGGIVWAEGKIDNGATFWFNLPKSALN